MVIKMAEAATRDINPATLASTARKLLAEDPFRYRNFGCYWFYVKELMKRYYDKNQVPYLGDYSDDTVSERIPEDVRASQSAMLCAAVDEYRSNAFANMGANMVTDPDGEKFMILDSDIE